MTGPSQKAHACAHMLPLLFLAVTMWSGCDEHREYSYRTLADAVAAGETTRGWLPDWLPPSSRAIKLLHASDSPATWGAFEFWPAEAGQLRQHLSPLGAALPHIPSPARSWWPDFLSGKLDTAALRKREFDLYVTAEPAVNGTYAVLFAVNEGKGAAFFYRNPAEGAR